MGKKRREVDRLGEVEVPSEAYDASQTLRAIRNFSISGIPISHLPQFIQALAVVKKAAVRGNARLGDIPSSKATAIAAACDDIIAGDLDAEFPIDVFQGGAGTSTNMNINEVIANRALEHLGFPRGRYECIAGVTANVERCRQQHLEASTAVVTALTPLIGYQRASDIAKLALKSGQEIWAVLQSELHLAPELLNQLREPSTLTRPGKAQELIFSEGSPEVPRSK